MLVLTIYILYLLFWKVEEVIFFFPKGEINSFTNSLQYTFEKERRVLRAITLTEERPLSGE